MKKILLIAAAVLCFTVSAFTAEHDHSGHGMNYLGNKPSGMAHQGEVDGIKATFTVKIMKEAMKEMGLEMPKGMKETHHLSVSFNDIKTGKALTEGKVAVKIQGPDKVEQSRELQGMQGHFGADFEMAKKGNYGISCTFKLKDGKSRQIQFLYAVK